MRYAVAVAVSLPFMLFSGLDLVSSVRLNQRGGKNGNKRERLQKKKQKAAGGPTSHDVDYVDDELCPGADTSPYVGASSVADTVA